MGGDDWAVIACDASIACDDEAAARGTFAGSETETGPVPSWSGTLSMA